MQTETVLPAPPALSATPHCPGVDIAPAPDPIPAAHPERAAALDRLANLWRADDLRPDTSITTCQATGFAALDAELPGGGWPAGQLIELLLTTCGIGELGLIVPALAQLARGHRTCVWVLPHQRSACSTERGGDPARDALPYPPALAAAGVDLTHSLFVRPAAPRESLWAIEQALRAAHLGAVVGWLPAGTAGGDFRALRRLQLLANQHRALVFVLREAQCAQSPSPAALRLQLAAADDGLNVSLLKRRGRPLLEPLALQVHPEHWRSARLEPAPAVPQHTLAPAAATSHNLPALALQRWSLRTLFSH